jgi:hypothetical protein
MTSNSAALPLWVEIWVEIRRCLESVTVGAAFSRSVHLDAGDRALVMPGAPVLSLLGVHDRHDE